VRKEVYLKNHPPEKYGCVLCHEGQARATTSARKAHGEVEYWLRPRYSGVMAQASCIKCHTKDVKLAGGEDLWRGIKLFKELGCYGCHETEGFGKDVYKMIGPDLTKLSSKLNPEWIVKWLTSPSGFRPTTRMPDFKLEDEDIRAITSFLWQKSKDTKVMAAEVYDEEMIEEGAYLFESVGCLACHNDVEDSERSHGPNLARIGEKVDYDFLVSWLLKPKAYQPGTKMPDFRLDDEEAAFLAAYLMSLRRETYEAPTEEAKWLYDKEAARRGEHLVNRYGCFGCHKIEGMEGKSKIGVGLTEIGSKNIHLFDFGLLEKKILGEFGLERLTENIGEARRSWISAKLSNPKQFDEGRYRRPEDRLRMPDFGLNKDEVEALSILLLGLREEELPKSYMYKLTNEQRNLAEGRRLVEKYNCMGCHQFSIDKLILEDGSEIKGIVKLEEEDSLFFQLWEDNVRLGRKAGETARVKKSWIKDRIKSEGGDIASFIIDYHVEEEGRVPEEARVFTPPVLYEEGKKVQFPWLYEFVNKPVPLRPWLDIRMPTLNFQPDEVTSIVRYFATMDNEQYPYDYFEETDKEYIKKKEKGYLAKARNLFESKDINCASCHVRGDVTPEGEPSDWAPDLLRARKRLKPDWIVRWLLNPQLIQPGTKMPRFFREDAFQDIFPGNRRQQVEAIKDLLMNFPQDMLVTEERGEETDIVPPLSSQQDMLAAKDPGNKKCVIRPWLGY
jgi:mono/diheme cytochrome c family protein